jgi:hypothetical protein
MHRHERPPASQQGQKLTACSMGVDHARSPFPDEATQAVGSPERVQEVEGTVQLPHRVKLDTSCLDGKIRRGRKADTPATPGEPGRVRSSRGPKSSPEAVGDHEKIQLVNR